MTRKLFITSMIVAVTFISLSACHKDTGKGRTKISKTQKAEEHHKAYHNGCLNAVVTCENGHVEVRVDEDVMKCWFVSGGSDTGRSVPIGDFSIQMIVKSDQLKNPQSIVLDAKPITLAGETLGSCSYFEGQKSWLAGLKSFIATGTVTKYKGKSMPIRIEYPQGYDPD